MDISGINCLGLDRVLRRGSGKIIADGDDALLIRDSISGAYLLACEDEKAGTEMLDRYTGRDCSLLMVSDYSLGMTAFERYGFSGKLECYQVAYYGERPECANILTTRTAGREDLAVLTANYHMLSPGEIEKVVERKSVMLGYHEDRLVGFIGEHLEGSMGMLYVFPEYRRRGFGTALEKLYIAETREKGFIPFGQVEKENSASLALQEKIGMTRSDSLIVWMWK